MTFAAALARERPDEIALRDPSVSLTWAQVDAHLRSVVQALLATELGPARRVAVFAENSARTVLAYAAATLAGTSAVAVNFHLTPTETAYLLTDSGAEVLVVDDSTAERGLEAAALAGVRTVVGGTAPRAGLTTWDAWTAAAPGDEPPTDRAPLPTLVYTSGTTGRPKGVSLPPTSFVGGADVEEHLARLREGRLLAFGRHLVVGPLYHSGPLTSTRLLLGGCPLTVLGRFDPEAVLQALDHDRIGSSIMVPTHFQRMLALPADVRAAYDTSALRYLLQVGAKCPEGVKRDVIAWFGDVVWESYGASEVGTTCMISAAEWLERPGSVGRAVPPFEAFVLDADGDTAAPGEQGELWFRDTTGHGIRYENGAGVASGDTFTLGEIGVMDAEGYVWITDRASDMVVSGGVNIYPAEAEQVLAGHPQVGEVACLGVPDEEMGEQLIALVVPAPGQEPEPAELVAFARERLATYKCPRRVELVAELARTPVGKLDKRALRAPYWPAAQAVGR